MFDFKRKDLPVLVIGAGSIGERHIRNLWFLGFQNIIVYRQRNLPFRNIENATVKVVTDWDDVVDLKPQAAIICTPTAQHLFQVYDCLQANLHVLVEKPLANQLFNLEDLVDLVKQNNVLLHVGYMLRYHPLLKQIKDYIEKGTFGNVLNIQSYWGEYLPDWHSWEDYRYSYAAKKEQGGGAALTLSHDVDVVNWLMNTLPTEYKNIHNYASNLDVTADSGFDLIMLYPNKATAHVHVNYHQKVAQRWYKVVLDEAIIDLDYINSTITISTPTNVTVDKLIDFDRNNMFIDELKDFFLRIDQKEYFDFSKQQIYNSHSIIKACINE